MKYISLLRGINVAGKKKIIMKELKTLYESLGFENVITYIQSGNVIFDSNDSAKVLVSKIKKSITLKYGFTVPIQVREKSEFNDIALNCPFNKLDLIKEGTKVMVTFLNTLPTQENIINLMKYIKEPECLVVIKSEVYLYCPNGYGTTKLNNNFLESKLKVEATTRNWKSVLKLKELIK